MQYRTDPKTKNQLSALGLGCMRFERIGVGIDFAKAERIICEAVDQGVNYFDTAYIYPGSEETLGNALAKNSLRDKVNVATKLPILLCKSGADFEKYFSRQLGRLKTDRIDYYLLHMLTDTDYWKKLQSWGIEDWAAQKKASGQIKRFGFSFHGIKSEFMKLLDSYDWDFCQIQYNYSDENYQAGVDGLKKASEKGMAVVIMEPLLGGKLASGLPTAAAEIFRETGLSPAAWALKWLWNQPEPTVVLSGMNSLEQLKENAANADSSFPMKFTEKEYRMFKEVTNIFSKSYRVKCTGCGYCMPCPSGVNIPACFSAYNAAFAISKSVGQQQYTTSTGGTTASRHFASQCVKCGKCEKHCPQSIPIREKLSDVAKTLEPFWFKPGLALARAFLGVKK
jgi:predicted aldo/keto reductase-like oxidoreductase